MIAIFTAGLRYMDTRLLRYRLMLVLYTNVHEYSTERERGTGKRKWKWEMGNGRQTVSFFALRACARYIKPCNVESNFGMHVHGFHQIILMDQC